MAQPGRQGVTFPDNLFNTWLGYRESLGQTRAEIIREVNEKLDRKYDNDRFYRWKKQKSAVAEPVVIHFILPELPEVLLWFFIANNMPVIDVDFKLLASAVAPPIKNLSL